jgi:hypothetical protein
MTHDEHGGHDKEGNPGRIKEGNDTRDPQCKRLAFGEWKKKNPLVSPPFRRLSIFLQN